MGGRGQLGHEFDSDVVRTIRLAETDRRTSPQTGYGSPTFRSRRSRRLRIAMIGQKGVPATFGGIEHHVEELGARLVERGHEVTVFCRSNYVHQTATEYRGMRLAQVPTIGTKHLDAFAHSATSTLAAMRDSYDVIHYHALGPGLFAFAPRYASRAKVALTVHGLDHMRAKWGRGAKTVLRTAGWLSARVPDVTVTVSQALTDHYAHHYQRRAIYIPNGVAPISPRPRKMLENSLHLNGKGYVLFVGRLVPEKLPDLLIKAFSRIRGDLHLVFAGGTSFTNDYVQSLRMMAASDPRIMFTGYIFGEALAALYSNASVFVLPSELEGLPLTLLEAAASGTPIVASDIPPHVEIIADNGPGHRLFRTGDLDALTLALKRTLADVDGERRGAARLRERVLRDYSWDDAVEATEEVYMNIVEPGRPFMSIPSTQKPAQDGGRRVLQVNGADALRLDEPDEISLDEPDEIRLDEPKGLVGKSSIEGLDRNDTATGT
jgi:glycosyltransferase involved in cell wall biosynthesis